jgi:hypothetical protein
MLKKSKRASRLVTAKIYNLMLNGELKTCEQCAITKDTQRTLTKTGRVEVESLETDFTWTLFPLRTYIMEDSIFAP